MTGKVLHLFADTNLFLQCKMPRELGWSKLSEWDAIDVIITRPVQTEIDGLKGRGNGRQASRARLASSLIRELLEKDDGRTRVADSPTVHVCLRHDLRRAETDAGALDYGERDDQLVGTVLAFARANPDAEVRLLTNDTGPMASAKAVNVRYMPIPDDWLLPPETDEAEKQESKLRAELARLRRAEPAFEISVIEPAGGRLAADVTFYTKVSEDEADSFVRAMKAKVPIATEFGSSERRAPGGLSVGSAFAELTQIYEPATPSEIAKYQERYEAWLEECRSWALDLSSALNAVIAWPSVAVSIGNTGSRPAEDALVALRVTGKVGVLVPESGADAEEAERKAAARLEPPRPPTPPSGSWKDQNPYSGLWRGHLGQDLRGLQRAISVSQQVPHILSNFDRGRDPNGFYFKSGQRGLELHAIEYVCEQWRHAQGPEEFHVEVRCGLVQGVNQGALEVEVHAANLTDPVKVRVPVTINVAEASPLEYLQRAL